MELNHQWKNSNSNSPPKASVMTALQTEPLSQLNDLYHIIHTTGLKCTYLTCARPHLVEVISLQDVPLPSMQAPRASQCGTKISSQAISPSHLYLSGSCLRINSTEEMAYRPVSSVRTRTKLVLLPAPEIAKKNCTYTQLLPFSFDNSTDVCESC